MKKLLLTLGLGLTLCAATLHQANVLESLNSGGYTYMKVKEGKNTYWVAMTQRSVHVGDTIKYEEQGWMHNFHSKTLNRDFDKILFASDVPTQTQAKKLQNIQPDIMTSKYKNANTLTIAELFKNRDKYVGKKITLRAKVTKVSQGIMGLNWVHLQDGSRFSNIDDLVFTTKEIPPHAGEVVYAKGTAIKDKDFGYGYFYPLIIQNATFSK